MKKEDLYGLLVYLIIFGFAIVFGLTVLKDYSPVSGLSGGAFFGYIAGAIATGIVLNALIFELGHLLGAKLGGYEVLSFNVLGFCFYKKDNKLKFRFANFDGLTGQTKIAPKKNLKKEANPTPYLIMGSFLYALILIPSIILFVVLNSTGEAKSSNTVRTAYFILTVAVIGLMILVYDIVPLKLDANNDGYRLRLVSNPRNKEAFNELLRVENAIANGEKDVEIKTFETITNFTADLNLNKVYTLLDNDRFDEALPYINTILKNKDNISSKVYISSKAQKIYIDIMTRSVDEALEYYNKEVPVSERRIISEDSSMPSIRAYILMSGILDKSRSETELALNKVIKAFKRTPKNRQPIEMKLYNNALKRVIDAHPNWNLDGYLLEEVNK